ncbi:hypothetical protein D3C86_1519930 [compost metagenome]
MRQLRLGFGLIQAVRGSQLALRQMTQALIIALPQAGTAAVPLAVIALGLEARFGGLYARQSVILAQAHQDRARLHLLAFVDQQLTDLTAQIE